MAEVQVQGYSGATLEQVVDQFDFSFLKDATAASPTIVIFCAGENDIGNGIPLKGTIRAMDKLLENMAVPSSSSLSHHNNDQSKCSCHLIVLGPKFEPWLNDDSDSQKQYTRLSEGMQRRCMKRTNVTFLDCLCMFCDNANQADSKFFHKDQLHLNDEGYRKWKRIVEKEVQRWCDTTITEK
jgi:lysophospholipase L1-like esterase